MVTLLFTKLSPSGLRIVPPLRYPGRAARASGPPDPGPGHGVSMPRGTVNLLRRSHLVARGCPGAFPGVNTWPRRGRTGRRGQVPPARPTKREDPAPFGRAGSCLSTGAQDRPVPSPRQGRSMARKFQTALLAPSRSKPGPRARGGGRHRREHDVQGLLRGAHAFTSARRRNVSCGYAGALSTLLVRIWAASPLGCP